VVICLERGADCAYGPADATASQNSIDFCLILNPDWFYLSGTGLRRLSTCPGTNSVITFTKFNQNLIQIRINIRSLHSISTTN